jgi:hypothetical protein
MMGQGGAHSTCWKTTKRRQTRAEYIAIYMEMVNHEINIEETYATPSI